MTIFEGIPRLNRAPFSRTVPQLSSATRGIDLGASGAGSVIGNDKAFGDVFRELRAELGLSQEDLALACGRHRTYVSLLERGHNSPSLKTLFLPSRVLKTRPSTMLRLTEQRL